MNGFEAGPWDNKRKADGAHVFSKQRKLMYGDEHDRHGEDEQVYGERELDKMHYFWRRNALNHMKGVLARANANKEPFAKISKVAARRGPTDEWPGDLGKHPAIIEELLKLGVVTVHQESGAAYAKIVPARLFAAIEKFAREDAQAKAAGADAKAKADGGAASSAAPSADKEYFLPSEGFTGARRGYVFHAGDEGLGYYLDGVESRAQHAATAAAAAAALPDGWVKGASPEGYPYYWHAATSTSSWEKPTGPPPTTRKLPLSAAAAAALAGPRNAALAKIESDSAAAVRVEDVTASGGTAVIKGSEAQVARACVLLQRKADAADYAARAFSAAAVEAQAPPPPQTAAVPDYSFSHLAGFVAEADASREVIKKLGGAEPEGVAEGGGGGLAMLSAYADDEEDDE